MTKSKSEAMGLFETYRKEWLDRARQVALDLGRSGAPVNINMVRAVSPPIPDEVDPRVAGAVFAEKHWKCLGYIKSARRVSHGRPVAQFILV